MFQVKKVLSVFVRQQIKWQHLKQAKISSRDDISKSSQFFFNFSRHCASFNAPDSDSDKRDPVPKNVRPLPKNSGEAEAKFDFLGKSLPYSHELKFINPDHMDPIPVYRVMSDDGRVVNESEDPKLSADVLLKMYKDMVLLNNLDVVMSEAEAKQIISLYVTSFGEEAAQIGSAAALDSSDLVYAQYRESGILIWRGLPMSDLMNQCLCNDGDNKKGRQMPIHYGSRELNYVTIASTLATQMPHAAGSAYAYKLSGRENCVVCYFGEGTTSEGDAHAAFNFAAVLSCPVVFFCRNNGYAISTTTDEQYRGDGIASRGSGYGMISIRVDGNDVLAVYNVTKAAREISLTERRPVLVEAMTYRVGDHTTLVDSSDYRTDEEVSVWKTEKNPIDRFRKYLSMSGLWDEKMEEKWQTEAREIVSDALTSAQEIKLADISNLFEDVYDVMPANLRKQMRELKQHVKKYKEHYPLDKHVPFDLD